MALPSVIIYFTSYDEIKRRLGYHEINNPNQLIPALSGGLARTFSVTAISPLELIRTKIQSERLGYRNVLKFVKEAIQKHG
jgi:solute carrier family 25 protein 39/40